MNRNEGQTTENVRGPKKVERFASSKAETFFSDRKKLAHHSKLGHFIEKLQKKCFIINEILKIIYNTIQLIESQLLFYQN